MSKRTQILVPEAEYRQVMKLTKGLGITVADWVRDLIRAGIEKKQKVILSDPATQTKIASLNFFLHS